MLKRFRLGLLILLVLGGVAGTIVGVTYEEQKTSVKYQRDCYEHSAPVLAGNPEKDKASHNKCEDAKDYMPWWYVLVAWPEGITTWALLFTLGVIIWQAIETRRSVQAVRDSLPHQKNAADAAFLNAQAVINSERPWVAIFANPEQGGYSFRASNVGRTPAHIVSFSTELKCIKTIGDLPAEPVYQTSHLPKIRLLIPGAQLGQADIELLSTEDFVDHAHGCNPRLKDYRLVEFAKADKYIPILYFRVIYRWPLDKIDSKTTLYESRTCFAFIPWDAGGNLKVVGEEPYNRHT